LTQIFPQQPIFNTLGQCASPRLRHQVSVANSKHDGDTLCNVLPNTPDIRNLYQHKAVDLHAIRTVCVSVMWTYMC